jgi:lipoprotein NlpI/transglutaminase-like putative cysteine protease
MTLQPYQRLALPLVLLHASLPWGVGLLMACGALAAAPVKPAAPSKPTPAAALTSPSTAAANKAWQVAPIPAWVVAPPAGPAASAAPAITLAPALSLPGLPTTLSAAAPAASGLLAATAARHELMDWQTNFTLAKPQFFIRQRSVAYDAATLGYVSQWQIGYNPAFQTITLHSAQVLRDGRMQDRLKDARIEALRRETQLERQIIDGTQTLLVVLSDVRVGEPVEVSYTIEGVNPIFEGRLSGGFETAAPIPTDLVHHRVILPADRNVQLRAIGGDLLPERSIDNGKQVLRLVRTKVPALVEEQQTPPWVKVYPSWYFSEYGSWAEVDAWAQRLFAKPAATAPAIKAKADEWRANGLQGEALVAEVLRFVQDEVRYFSVSLGESSHRPKLAERTLAERLGDCKDKVMLLNALLAELGLSAQPALVSMFRNRGLAQYLPSHDQFDHVISRVELGGRVWYLDPTISGQGLTLASRGHYPYGRALVVGVGQELATVTTQPGHVDEVEHVQRWDMSQPGKPTQLATIMRAKGAAAERWRASWASAGQDRITEALAGAYARVLPELARLGPAQVKDDRQANVFELNLAYEHPNFGVYGNGGLDIEVGAFELADVLVSPAEAVRRTPYLLAIPQVSTSRIDVITPLPFTGGVNQPAEVFDKGFQYSSRTESSGNTVSFLRRVERRSDDVAPADMAGYRENLLRARAMTSNRMRINLVNFPQILPAFQQIEKRVRSEFGPRDDGLARIVMRAEFNRHASAKVLSTLPPKSRLAAHVLASSAISANLLGQYSAALQDAGEALAIDPGHPTALEARAVALASTARLDESVAALEKLLDGPARTVALRVLATVEIQRSRHSQAEQHLRQLIDASSGEQRDFALAWLYLAAERQGGRGAAVLQQHLASVDGARWSGALVNYLSGKLDREALLKKARDSAEMERLNLAEAYYYIGHQLAAQGQREEALRWYDRTVQTKATPYREYALAQQELKSGK